MLLSCLLIALTAVVCGGDAPAKEAPKAEDKAAEKDPEVATIDKKAPDFTLKDAAGTEHKLSNYAEKLVVLEWVNFDCPFVKKHYSKGDMVATARKYRDKGVVWLLVCSSGPGKQGNFEGKALTDRLTKEGVDAGHYLIDDKGTVGRAYQAKTTPHMFVIDKKGILRYQGAVDSVKSVEQADIAGATNYVAAALDELIAGKAVTTKETKPYGCGMKFAPKEEAKAEAKEPAKSEK
ncbi:MAG: redoxin domain-containing protein [Planctomycetes bacterium]|nr:redoxin domain-containing protein [Planctomycetota bacterium]